MKLGDIYSFTNNNGEVNYWVCTKISLDDSHEYYHGIATIEKADDESFKYEDECNQLLYKYRDINKEQDCEKIFYWPYDENKTIAFSDLVNKYSVELEYSSDNIFNVNNNFINRLTSVVNNCYYCRNIQIYYGENVYNSEPFDTNDLLPGTVIQYKDIGDFIILLNDDKDIDRYYGYMYIDDYNNSITDGYLYLDGFKLFNDECKTRTIIGFVRPSIYSRLMYLFDNNIRFKQPVRGDIIHYLNN